MGWSLDRQARSERPPGRTAEAAQRTAAVHERVRLLEGILASALAEQVRGTDLQTLKRAPRRAPPVLAAADLQPHPGPVWAAFLPSPPARSRAGSVATGGMPGDCATPRTGSPRPSSGTAWPRRPGRCGSPGRSGSRRTSSAGWTRRLPSSTPASTSTSGVCAPGPAAGAGTSRRRWTVRRSRSTSRGTGGPGTCRSRRCWRWSGTCRHRSVIPAGARTATTKRPTRWSPYRGRTRT